MLKKIGIALLGVVVFVIALFSWSYVATIPLRSMANDFIDAGGHGKIDQAYEMTNATFKSQTSLTQLETFFNETSLGKNELPNWQSWNRATGGVGSVEGAVTVQDSPYLVKVNFQKGDDGWEVSGLALNPKE